MSAHLVFCWELGQGYGHILSFKYLAEYLVQKQWQISCIAKDVKIAKAMLPTQCKVYPAPARKYQPVYHPTANLAQIITNNGFFDDQWLQQSVTEWQQRFQTLKPDILLLDHAPTALLAAYLSNIKASLIGTGFFIPPHIQPLPNFESMTEDVSGAAEQRLMARINRMLPEDKCLSGLAQLYQTAAVHFLCTLPELDHYPGRKGADYWGPNFDLLQGSAPSWKSGAKRRVFAYLHNDYNKLHELLAALNELQASVLVSVKQVRPEWTEQYSNIQFIQGPVALQQVIKEADLVMCHAGHGTVAAMLLAGVKLLLVPKQLEQSLLAHYLCKQHLSYFLTPDADFSQLARYLDTVLADSTLEQQLNFIKHRYDGFCRQEQIEGMADALEDLLI